MLIKGDASEASSFRSVEIKLSPVVEMVSSLHVLASPDIHPIWKDWSTSILSSMDAASREEFDFLSNITMQWNLLMDFVCYIERHNIDSAERFIASIEAIDRVDFMYGIFSGLLPRQTVKEALEGNLETLDTDSPIFRHYVSVERARWLIEHEKDVRARISTFLKAYWEQVFSRLWQDIGVRELDRLADERRLLGQIGAESYIRNCHPQIVIEQGAIRFEKQVELSYRHTDIENVVVIISAFIAPDLMVNCVEGCLTIYKGISLPLRSSVEVSEEIALFLKAIGSPMKLRILIELQASPKTTKELAETLRVAPSSISAHLHQMREAELVYPQRVQNAVYYRFLNENYQANLAYLARIFEPEPSER